MIELINVNKIFQFNGEPFHALKYINLTIKQGEIFGVLGKSGAGKSTLLRSVNLLERPTSGQVFVNQVNLTTLTPQELRAERRKIGIIFQNFNLLDSRTVYDNIALPLEIIHTPKKQIQQKVINLLALVGLSEKKEHYPAQLSGGQKQRVAIARALATDPHVLLCDEATSALDTASTQAILNLLQQINQELGLTILLITHELEVIKRICDRVGVIDQGQLVEVNTTLGILSHPQVEATKKLVQQSLHICLPPPTKKNTILLKLTFIGQDSEQPLISTLAKKFNITLNIIQALIEQVQNTTVGFTICEITGEPHELQLALSYIQSTSIQVEVINHA